MLSRTTVLNMFGHSPIKPLQSHMEKAYACVALLAPFLESMIEQDWDRSSELQQEISALEDQADYLKNEIRTHLPKNLFLTVSRADLLELLTEQEKLPNAARDIAGIMLGRQMQIPAAIQQEVQEFLSRCIRTTDQAKKIISELGELMESVFRGKEAVFVYQLLKELNELESETDRKQIKLRYSIFKIEKELPPIDVIFLYQVIELIGSLADHAQQVGNRLQMLMAD
jgi:predicted phosphate transport protein (TIGR00153 family)